MDTLYSVGRVYKLVSSNGLVYIGSTKKTLSQRLSKHKNDYKRFLKHKMTFVSSFKLFENENSVSIEPLEEHYNISKYNLEIRERTNIKSNICVNMCIPTRTQKEYDEDNKEKSKEYRTCNKKEKKNYDKE